MYIVSACLAGRNCKYDGGNNECPWVVDFTMKNKCVLVCPEIGRLGAPRAPVEITGGRAVSRDGKDVTDEFVKGAEDAWKLAESAAEDAGETIGGAILKANSPSCGCGTIYDGAFRGKLAEGDGFFAKLLKSLGIAVMTEKEKIIW